MIKAEIKKCIPEPKPPKTFPRLLVDPRDGMVILATAETEYGYLGVVLHKDREGFSVDVGLIRNDESDAFSKTAFCTDFVGDLILSNKD